MEVEDSIAVHRPERWSEPMDASMDDADVLWLRSREPFASMDAKAFPRSIPLEGILRNDCRIKRCEPGEIIVREGDYGNSAFLVLAGSTNVIVDSLSPGQMGRSNPDSRPQPQKEQKPDTMRRDELRLPLPPNNDRPGDRWMCGRRGGQQPCLRGPSDRGVCPMEPACQVRRSWYGRRRRALLIATLILLGILLFMMRSPHQLTLIKPGNLSNPHAQILAGTITSQRCAACHPQATDPNKTWFNGSSEGHQQVTQTDACLDCHHKIMPRSVAKLAHNLNAEQLAELKKSRDPRQQVLSC